LRIWHKIFMKPILEIQHITKQFKIGIKQESYLSLRDTISQAFKKKSGEGKDFLALNDVSFDVYPGQSVGIIGKNGAGKSTLLKILSRITPPTKGKIICRGRIASLLEVGTGFHPELSGRENIYMNGSILGMRKAEIDKHFDEIINFSGVEKFIDTPLKRYSSGMQLRLAFSVAAHLEPEIMVIDEVLAVGDAEFQKKCLGKMDEVSKSGRTVIFVSHDMNAIEHLCTKVVILQKGNLVKYGDTHQLIAEYLNENKDFNQTNLPLTESTTLAALHFKAKEIFSGDELQFGLTIDYTTSDAPLITDLCLLLYSLKGVRVGIIDLRPYLDKIKTAEGKLILNGIIDCLNLVEGEYSIGMYYGFNEVRKELLDITQIRVKAKLSLNTKVNPYLPQHRGYLELISNIKID
jgi:lipopolysaccharide transport system ATP-binding protein